MKIAKGSKDLVMNGKWAIGWISSKRVLYVSNMDSHELFLVEILRSFDFDVYDLYSDGWSRLVNGTIRKDFKSGILGVSVSSTHYKNIKHIIKNFVPFYEYFHTVYFDILYKSGKWKYVTEKLHDDTDESEELFSLNPYNYRR